VDRITRVENHRKVTVSLSEKGMNECQKIIGENVGVQKGGPKTLLNYRISIINETGKPCF
jgi:hypothetical protein